MSLSASVCCLAGSDVRAGQVEGDGRRLLRAGAPSEVEGEEAANSQPLASEEPAKSQQRAIEEPAQNHVVTRECER